MTSPGKRAHIIPNGRRSIALVAGGTAGHVRAALAVGEAYRRLRPDVQIAYIGARHGYGQERHLVPAASEDLALIDARPVAGQGVLGAIRAANSLLVGLAEARQIYRRNGTQLVIGFGSYATPPAVLAAASLGLVTAIHEANIAPGRANRFLGRFSTQIFVTFDDVGVFHAPDRVMVVGQPVDADIATLVEVRRSPPDLAKRHARIVVTGGGLGSRFLNREACHVLALLRARGLDLTVVHQTGTSERSAVAEAYAKAAVPAEVVAYLDDIAAHFRWADFVISTAGAGTLAELALAGLPALVVPLGWAADDHQTANARYYANSGGVLQVAEQDWDADQVASEISWLLRDRNAWTRFSMAQRQLARPGAAMAIAECCERLLMETATGNG